MEVFSNLYLLLLLHKYPFFFVTVIHFDNLCGQEERDDFFLDFGFLLSLFQAKSFVDVRQLTTPKNNILFATVCLFQPS